MLFTFTEIKQKQVDVSCLYLTSTAVQATPMFHRPFSSRLMRLFPGLSYPVMRASLTRKVAALTKNYPLWTNVVFLVEPRQL
jgi:hypothetical protein